MSWCSCLRVSAETFTTRNFAEKARWALDWFEAPYIEKPYLPVLSTFGVIANGGISSGKQDRGAYTALHAPLLLVLRWVTECLAVSTSLSTPLLITNDGKKLHDSADILKVCT